jgi:uncharacterized membrane protein YoaK (UPF0700 family)
LARCARDRLAHPGEPRHIATRDGLVVLLTLTTGAVDVSSFLHPGNVFGSVITGNLVLLGLSSATLTGSRAWPRSAGCW